MASAMDWGEADMGGAALRKRGTEGWGGPSHGPALTVKQGAAFSDALAQSIRLSGDRSGA
jgi:hypothetical protein